MRRPKPRKAKAAKIKVTSHAHVRLSERTGADAAEHAGMADYAWRHGMKPSRFKGPFHDFLMSKQLKGDRTCIKALGDMAYVFDNRNRRLITAWPIPKEYLPIEDSIGRDWGDWGIRLPDGKPLIGPDWEPAVFTSRQAAENRIKNDYTLLYEGAVPYRMVGGSNTEEGSGGNGMILKTTPLQKD